MPKPWYSIKAAAAGSDTAEVSILDVISPYYGVNAQTFLAEFRALKEPNVKVFINSPGGDVVQSLAIFNGMRASGKNVTAHVLGIAASAASYIAMAAQKVVMPRNTMMLPHKPSNWQGGTADDHREIADMLDTVENLLIPAYMARFKGTEEELKALLAEDKLLSAEQCLEHGFCDELVDDVSATAEFDLEMLPEAARVLFEATRKPEPKPAAPLAFGAEDVQRLAAEAGLQDYAAVFATDPKAVSEDAARALIAQARETITLCRIAGLEAMAPEFIRSRKSLAEARVALATAQAEADAATAINTARPSTTVAGAANAANYVDTNALWKEIKAMNAGSTTK